MRDLLYKNLTSGNKTRKIIATAESFERQGVRNIINRHFICLVKEIKNNDLQKPMPYLYILKERNTRENREKFFLKMKGSLYTIYKGKIYLILFMHSLRIRLSAANCLTKP